MSETYGVELVAHSSTVGTVRPPNHSVVRLLSATVTAASLPGNSQVAYPLAEITGREEAVLAADFASLEQPQYLKIE